MLGWARERGNRLYAMGGGQPKGTAFGAMTNTNAGSARSRSSNGQDWSFAGSRGIHSASESEFSGVLLVCSFVALLH